MGLGKLYMIATPLGNLKDMTQRGLDALKNLEYFFAEDTRELKKLLMALGISGEKKIFSYSSHNMKAATEKAMSFLAANHEVGFVSDRGTPGISDPGALLAAQYWEAGGTPIPLPGVSSPIALLSVSGFSADQFLFLGFLPLKPKAREALWAQVEQWAMATCFFESPKRIEKTLTELAKRFPDGEVVIGRELTKTFEEIKRFPLKALKSVRFEVRGEFTAVLMPGKPPESESEWMSEVRLRALSDKEWSKELATRFGVTAKTFYNTLQQLKSSSDNDQ